jgi:cysteine dioxygenase
MPSRGPIPDVVPGGYDLWELPASLRRLCTRIEAGARDGAVPLDVLYAELAHLELDLQSLAPWWIFDACRYRRNLIRRTPEYEALLLCWLPGQRSPIHDHRGSGCAFRVVEGVVTETLYEVCSGDVRSGGAGETRAGVGGDLATPATMRWLPPGTLCASRDFDVHEVANTDAKADLVTLHVYSPPLRDVNIYRSTEVPQAS